jgi:porin
MFSGIRWHRGTLGITPALAAVTLGMMAAFLPMHAYEVSPEFSADLTAAGAVQYQWITDFPDSGKDYGAALPILLDLDYRPWTDGLFHVKLGYAEGNGLNQDWPSSLAPWAADLEDVVTDINGRGRNYLLVASYRQTFALSPGQTLRLTGGIIDSTQYLDLNSYANNEYTQFMNEAFVNSATYGLPSYDYGLAGSWTMKNWEVNGVVMSVGENSEGRPYTFYGLEAGYHLVTDLGPGNIRLNIAGTNNEFASVEGDALVSRFAVGLSVDQALGQYFGGFLRAAWQIDEALVSFTGFLSGGVEIKGKAWRRDDDRVGLGVAFLNGGNSGVGKTQALEIYYRAVLSNWLSLTGDAQYMNDAFSDEASVGGWILGLRAAAIF